MFSENNQISGRQAFRLLSYDFLGIGTLLIPTAAANYAGRDGIFCIAAGVLFSLLYLKLLSAVAADMKEDYPSYIKKKFGKWIGSLVLLCYLVYFVFTASFTAYLFASLVLQQLVENVSFSLTLFLILLLAAYSMEGGIEGRARVYEMLFWFLMIPLFIMMLAAGRQVQTVYWSPIFTSDIKHIFTGGYYVFFCNSVVFLVLFLNEYMAKGSRLYKNTKRAICFSGAVTAVLYLILLGLFGADMLSSMQFPAVTMMSRVQVTGGFLKRTDAFLFGIWFFTLYALLNSMIFYGGNLLGQFFGKNTKTLQKKGKRLLYIPVILVVYWIAWLFYRNDAFLNMAQNCLWKIGTLFVVGIPVFLRLCTFFKSGKKTADVFFLAVILSGSFFLQGCGTTELENKTFPLLLNVRAEEDFEIQWLSDERFGNKKADYNHLKVVLIEREFLENDTAVNEMLAFLEKQQQLPWNSYIIVTESCDAIAETEENLDCTLGDYLEQLLENTSGMKHESYPTLGMLYQERKNHLETMFVPYISVVDEKPAVTAYEVWRQGKAGGLVDTDMAMASFLTQGKINEYAISLAPKQLVKITGVSSRIVPDTQIKAGGLTEKYVTVFLNGEGEILTGDKEQAEERLQDYLNGAAFRALENGIDITNSYKTLGAQKREWYFEYKDTPAFYEQEINIRYEVKINWQCE